MKRMAMGVLLLFLLPIAALAEALVPGGTVIGLQLLDGTVTVVDFDGENGEATRAAGLAVGDVLTEINGNPIHSAEDITEAIETAAGTVELKYRRGTKTGTVQLQNEPGEKLGLYLQQGITGVGTVTFYDPATGTFGTLGHGVSNKQGMLLQLEKGEAYHARVSGLQKGKTGQPGQLKGTAASEHPFAEITKNTPHGVFGNTAVPFAGEAVETAAITEVHPGAAVIRSTVEGEEPKEYHVEILKIDRDNRDGRNFLIQVRDAALLNTTGGIVQGMSGSPILQDGKLIGAVTHVLVNQPAMGYGIYIGNMLDDA